MENINTTLETPIQSFTAPIPPVQKQNNIYKVLFFISISVLIIVVAVFLFLFKNDEQRKNNLDQSTETKTTLLETEPTPTKTEEETPDIKQTLLSLQKSLKTNSPIKEFSKVFYTDWIADDGEREPLIGSSFCLSDKKYNDNCDSWGNFTDIREITKESLKSLKTLIDNFFISNGFNNDNKNTYNLGSYLDNFGYTKGNLKCSVRFNYSTSSLADFYCGVIDQDQMKLRKELYPAINPKGDKNVAFSVNKVISNYATGGIGGYSGGGGAMWVAVKLDGEWKFVYGGQDISTCDVIDKYNIPKEIYVSCYDTEKNEVRK